MGTIFGLSGTEHVGPDIVEHQREMMRRAGIDPRKLPSAGDIQNRNADAPPGDGEFELDERIINGRGWTGTVKAITKESGKLELRIHLDENINLKGMIGTVGPVLDKVRRLNNGSGKTAPNTPGRSKHDVAEIMAEHGRQISLLKWSNIFCACDRGIPDRSRPYVKSVAAGMSTLKKAYFQPGRD